jgi:predicted GNAT superfamily acetyltransferase
MSRDPHSEAAAAASDPIAESTAIRVRPLATQTDFDACVELQRETWGDAYRELVPASVLSIAQRMGGVASGAFVGDDLVGFVFGMTGVDDDRIVHWSHMLAVSAGYRGRGVGQRLKEHQRSLLRALGVSELRWSFDPLVARNAHLNLNRLGARIVDYVPDMYAPTGSPLHAFGTDRFVVTWQVRPGERVRRAEEARRETPPRDEAHLTFSVAAQGPAERSAFDVRLDLMARRPIDDDDVIAAAPVANTRPGSGAQDRRTPQEPVIRVEIPADAESLAASNLPTLEAWRASTRDALCSAFARGYRIAGFRRGPGEFSYYVLSR